jgi:hypothetical protein
LLAAKLLLVVLQQLNLARHKGCGIHFQLLWLSLGLLYCGFARAKCGGINFQLLLLLLLQILLARHKRWSTDF